MTPQPLWEEAVGFHMLHQIMGMRLATVPEPPRSQLQQVRHAADVQPGTSAVQIIA